MLPPHLIAHCVIMSVFPAVAIGLAAAVVVTSVRK
jgi:hypothetical protein